MHPWASLLVLFGNQGQGDLTWRVGEMQAAARGAVLEGN